MGARKCSAIKIILSALSILHPSFAYCAAQQTFAVRDARIRHRGVLNARDQFVGNEAISAPNATALLQQFPTRGYSLPRHTTPPEVAKYRNLGNYYQAIPLNTPLTMLAPPVPPFKIEHKRHLEHSTPVRFDHQVVHLQVPVAAPDIRTRRYTNSSSIAARALNQLNDDQIGQGTDSAAMETQPPTADAQETLRENAQNETKPTTIKKTQSFHDIYMRFGEPHQLSFGHVEFKPQKYFEKRFESLNNANGHRHRGEIVWTDATGGYGEHRWDLT